MAKAQQKEIPGTESPGRIPECLWLEPQDEKVKVKVGASGGSAEEEIP